MSWPGQDLQVLLASPGGWHLPQTAKTFEVRGALGALWISNKNSTLLPVDKYCRCRPFHVAMKPFLHLAPQIWEERAFYAFFPIWKYWLNNRNWPQINVVHAIMGFATEPFDRAERTGALKVVDCPNSHPTTYFGHWQRECDLWCPGERVPVPRWVYARMNRELERADLILCPSTFVRDSMVNNGIRGEKCFVNPFGVNTQIFKPRPEPPVRPKFVSVGTICVRKGHPYLFRAFEQVKRQLPDAELVCVGDIKTDIRKELPKWRGTFTYIPSLAHAELAKLLAGCTAFVMPSQEEGFARVLSEAMAAGLPILASHESGATTLVEDGVEGFIVRGRDPQHIAEAMLRVARDPDLGRRMGAAAYRKGAVGNTWQDYGDRLLTEYQRRLDERQANRPVA
jgi:glycosyltransferase involved in cell wall biosynthesis